MSDSHTETLAAVLGRIACWFVAGSAAVAGVAFVSIHAPPRVKILGLFAVVTGMAAGWLLGRLAGRLHVRTNWAVTWLTFVLIAAGQFGAGLGAHRIWADGLRRQYQLDPSSLLSGRIAAPDSVEADPHQRAEYRQMLEDYFEQNREQRAEALDRITRFDAFLRHRVSALPPPVHSWAGLFWGTEIVMAALAGAWIARETADVGGRDQGSGVGD